MEPFYESNRDSKSDNFQVVRFENLNFVAHLHNSVEILFLYDGEMLVTINNSKHRVIAEKLAIMLPDDIHSYETIKSSRGVILIFSESYLCDFRKIFKSRTIKENILNAKSSKTKKFIDTYAEIEDRNLKNFYAAGYINSLFYEILEMTSIINKIDYKQDILREVLSFIAKEYDKEISQRVVAERLGVSRTYLSRILNKKIGYSFNEYIGRLRIEKSKRLLAESDLNVLNIALECGFDNQRTFNRVFQKYVNTTPSNFKKSSL